MTTRRKESIKIAFFSILLIIILSMILATIILVIKTTICYEIQAKEYESEVIE